MAKSKSKFIELVLEQLASLEGVRAKAMFGGHGIYKGDLFFALVADDRLYLKADANSVKDFTSQGLGPFEFTMRGKTMTMQYYEAPAEALESPAVMEEWAGKAIAAARMAKKGDRRKKRKQS